jgi:hypothetical protein
MRWFNPTWVACTKSVATRTCLEGILNVPVLQLIPTAA